MVISARHPDHITNLTQVAAGFSCGSAIAVLTGGRLFCRMTAAGRRNLCAALSLGTIAVFWALLTPGLPTYATVGLLCWCALRVQGSDVWVRVRVSIRVRVRVSSDIIILRSRP